MPTAVKEEQWELNADVVGMASRDLAAKTADASLVPIWEYPVPVGVSLIFTKEDILSAYLEDNNTEAECVATGVTAVKVDIVIMDTAKQNVRSLLNLTRYGGIKEFQDANKLVHLDIAPSEQVIAREGERVCVRVDCPGAEATLDVSDSYFRLTCKRIRHTLFD